jgi:periplasmic protein TonB
MMVGTSEPRSSTNGSSHASLHAFATAGGMAYDDDPMSKVLGLDAKTSGVGAWFGFGSAGTLLMLWLMGLTVFVAWWRASHTPVEALNNGEIEIVREEPPPPPPPPPQEETKPEPPAAHVTPREAPPPPPAPAQAAKVLTQEPKPDEPVDLTGNTIIQGNADTYAGGFTTANGSSTAAVRSMPSPTGVPGGTGAPQAPAPPSKDLSRMASVGTTEWNCPFPPEADVAQMDEAWVTLQVDVRSDGTPASARVVSDPGSGFGREAKRCAMNKRFPTALDRDGNPIEGTTKPFRVHFQR